MVRGNDCAQTVSRDRDLPQRHSHRRRGCQPDRRRAGVRARGDFESGIPTVPAAVVRGVVLADCCTWRELRVRSIDSTPPRSRIETAVVHHGTHREFVGFNRACHAVLETAIYATRLHLLPREFVESELARLQTIVDKTAGPREFDAMAILTDYIRSAGSEPAAP